MRKIIPGVGAEVFLSDIDITRRVPSRQPNGAPKPINWQFVRRLAKASVMETRQSASQVNPPNIGLSADSVLDKSESSITSVTPQKQNLLFEAEIFKEQNQYRLCWAENSTSLRKNDGSRPIKIL